MTALWEVPEGWEWAEFREVATVESDLVDPAGFQSAPHIAPNHIKSGTGRLLEYTTVAADKVTSPKHRFKPGQILYSKIRPYLCKAVLIDFAGVCSADMYPIASKIDAAYLHRWMISPAFTEQASDQQGRTVLPKINQEALATLMVPVPPLAEQRRIVARIEALQAHSRKTRAELEAILPLLEQYRQSVLAAAFRGDLTAGWREQNPNVESASTLQDRIRQERQLNWEVAHAGKKYAEQPLVDSVNLPDLPETWCWVRIDDVGEVQLGRQRAPQYHNGPNMRPYLRVQNVFENRIDTSDVMEMDFSGDDFARYRLQTGDILLNEGQSSELVGRPAIYRGEIADACFTNTLVRFQSGPFVVPEYALLVFLHYLKSGRFQRIAALTVNIAHLGVGRFAGLEFPVPPLNEQRTIADAVFSALDRCRLVAASVDLSLKEVRELDNSILEAAFRGHFAEHHPADEPASVLLERIRAERNGTARPPAEQSPPPTKLVVSRYIVMLLRTWAKPAARETLETCLVLMMNDDARRAILGKKPAARARSKKSAGRTHMPGLDHLLGELVTGRILTPPETVKGKQVFGIGPKAPTAADIKAVVSGEDEQRLKETLQALEVLGEERARHELDAVPHANYEFVS